MGRVMSLYTLVRVGMTPLGALILGIIASRFGTGNTMSVGAALGFLVVLLVYVRGKAIREIT